MQFTLRRALEKLGAEVRPSRPSDVAAGGNTVAEEEDGSHQALRLSGEVLGEEERSSKKDDVLLQGVGASERQNDLAGELWLFNHQLGPYNVSFFCPSKNVSGAEAVAPVVTIPRQHSIDAFT